MSRTEMIVDMEPDVAGVRFLVVGDRIYFFFSNKTAMYT